MVMVSFVIIYEGKIEDLGTWAFLGIILFYICRNSSSIFVFWIYYYLYLFILFGFFRSNVFLIIMVLYLIFLLNNVVKFFWGLIFIIDFLVLEEVGIFNENSMMD